MSTADSTTAEPQNQPMPPVLSRLLRGTFWLALRTPLQAVFVFVSFPMVIRAIGTDANGAYNFAWGFGFLQFLLEFGMSSALQRRVSEAWTEGDRAKVDRTVACGLLFYAVAATIQAAALLAIAHLAMPYTGWHGESYTLIVRLLWLQAITAPFFGLTTVVSSILQAARRYDVIPRFELAVVVLRFAILAGGIGLGVPFFAIVLVQTLVQIGLGLGPAAWVMVRELGYIPKLVGATRADLKALTHVSVYMAIMQLSVVFSDKLDTTILTCALADPGPATTVYASVSKPFMQIRQTGWMLSYFVMPAAASLLAARDAAGLDRVKFDGSRLLIAGLLPVGLLAWIYAGPFLGLWVGDDFRQHGPLLRLFLVATLPLAISILVQVAIGLGKIAPIALAALAGSLVNLPLSYLLTVRIGVAGVIWGSVLTVVVANLIAPGIYVFRVLDIRPSEFLRRTLAPPLAGAAALVGATWLFRLAVPADPMGPGALARSAPLLANLVVGCLAYAAGYLSGATGRGDLAPIARKLSRRAPGPAAS